MHDNAVQKENFVGHIRVDLITHEVEKHKVSLATMTKHYQEDLSKSKQLANDETFEAF